MDMDTEYGGYLFIFDEVARARLITDYIERGNAFTDAISAPDWEPKNIELCFLSFDGESIGYAALARRGRKVATRKYQITFQNFLKFSSINFRELEAIIEPKLRSHFIRVSSGEGSRVPPKTWTQLFTVIKNLRSGIADELDELERLRKTAHQTFTGRGFDVVTQEKDAFDLALKIFGIELRDLSLQWLPQDHDQPAPFLKGLTEVRIPEDTLIYHDANVFGDWAVFKRYQIGAIEFERRREKLTIMNVNRTKIENTLGVDLFYYHHKFNSFNMVQYKRMERQHGQPIYRPIDKSYYNELSKMQAFRTKFLAETKMLNLDENRLHWTGFFFKLCMLETFNPSSTSLIPGMYLPLDYWEMLVNSNSVKGPREGIGITYDNVGRYLNNTLFIELVQNGWIGSKGIASTVLVELIRELLGMDRSAIIAISQPGT